MVPQSKTVWKKDLEPNSKTVSPIKENGQELKGRDMEHKLGLMVLYTRGIGVRIKLQG